MLPIRTILAAIDFSDPAHVALDKAIELAGHFGAELCLLHVVNPLPPLPTDLVVVASPDVEYDHELEAEATNRLRTVIRQEVPTTISARPVVRNGEPGCEIVRAAEDENADVIVLSTHGETGWRHLVFGSVAEEVVRTAGRPVLTIRDPAARKRHMA